MKDLSFSIRKIRELRGYSQEYMAAEIGVSTKTYAKIENGRTQIKLSKLDHICRLLGISIPQLMEFSVDQLIPENSMNKGAEMLEEQILNLKIQLELLRTELKRLST